ncbi:MAG: hypothetical protein WBV59_05385 [Anaerolineae bacterium]
MTDFIHSLALLIGIDAYANGIPRLTTAVNEVTRLADAAPGGSNSGASVEVRGDSCVGFQAEVSGSGGSACC